MILKDINELENLITYKNENKNTFYDVRQVFKNSLFKQAVSKIEVSKLKMENKVDNLDIEILKFLFRYSPVATTEQILRYLKLKFNNDITEYDLLLRLNKLIYHKVLNKFILTDVENEPFREDIGAVEFFCLETGGKLILMEYSTFDVLAWHNGKNFKCIEKIGKEYFYTEIYLKLLETLGENLISFEIESFKGLGGENFQISFDFKVLYNGEIKPFICEFVRKDEISFSFRSKIKKYDSLLNTNAWKKFYEDCNTAPILLVFGDNSETLKSCLGPIYTTKLDRVRYSTIKELQGELSKAFFKYEKEKEKFTRVNSVIFTKMR